ncbi:MAG: 3-phenylpropionate MFS transporter [Actinomycetota bacterium]
MTRASVAVRVSAFYAAVFAAIGVHLPFWPLWLKDRGLTPTDIGLVMAATYLTRIAGNPLIGSWVDRRGDRRLPIAILAGLAAASWLAFEPAHGLLPIMVVTMVAVGFFAGILPVGDTLAMMAVANHRLDYGRVRLWGSLAFIVAATSVGRLLVGQPPSVLLWLVFGLLVMTTAVALALPDQRIPAADRTAQPVMPLLKAPAFLLFLAATALNQAAHTVYYAFATIHWKASGLSDDTIGLLWSEGVVAEIALFLFSNAVVRRVGPAGLLLLAGIGGVARWLVLGTTFEIGWVASVQLLHAATFGCAHLGAMHFLQRAAPPALAVRAQTLFAAVAAGVAPGLMTPLTGHLFEKLGGTSFLAMSGLSLLSAAAAFGLMKMWDGGKIRL